MMTSHQSSAFLDWFERDELLMDVVMVVYGDEDWMQSEAYVAMVLV